MQPNHQTNTNTPNAHTSDTPAPDRQLGRKTRVVLWTAQAVLAALFLFAGGAKLVLPLAALAQQGPFPGLFLRFIGICEVAGALGLILPGLLRIRPRLTPLAAAGLVIIMIGATIATIITTGQVAAAAIPFVVGVIAAVVAYARRRPITGPAFSVQPALQAA
jgi:hypothetical protein